MASPRQSKRQQLSSYLAQARPAGVGEAEWEELRQQLAPISESYLRRLLRTSGLPLAPLVEGVRQESFEELERSLLTFAQEYAAAREAGNEARARACRRAVIEAKDHARLALRNPRTHPEKAAQKQEMILWLLTWLENPGVFSAWLRLRRQALEA